MPCLWLKLQVSVSSVAAISHSDYTFVVNKLCYIAYCCEFHSSVDILMILKIHLISLTLLGGSITAFVINFNKQLIHRFFFFLHLIVIFLTYDF